MQKPTPELVKQLRRQLDFIRNSASAYDAGHSEEALRIGVATDGRQSFSNAAQVRRRIAVEFRVTCVGGLSSEQGVTWWP